MAASYDLGTASAKVVIDYDGSSVTRATTDFNKLGGAVTDATTKVVDAEPLLRQLSQTALIAGAAIATGLGYAVKTAGDFEFGLSAIKAVSGATAKEMDLISEAALRIGKETAFSATDAASAMEELVKAGISVESVLGGAADATVSLAAAGSIQLPEAASIVAASLNQFKLSAEETANVADVLAGAANASATGVSEVGMALSFAGPAANAAGVSFEESATMIALFANNGIDGMKAGTALRAMLTQLQPSTEGAATAMEELGLITKDGSNVFYDAQGNIKSMEEIVGLLRGAFSGLSEQQMVAYSETIFGREQLSAMAAVVSTSAEEYDKLSAAIAGTSAADVAATRMDNFQGSLEELRGSVETLVIGLGDVLLPIVNDLVEQIQVGVDWFASLDKGVQTTVVTVAAIAAGGLLLVGVLGQMSLGLLALRTNLLLATGATTLFGNAGALATIKAGLVSAATGIWSAAQWVLNSALWANPLTWIIAGIVALIAAIVWVATQTTFFQDAWTVMVQAVTAAWETLVSWFQTSVEAVAGFFTWLWEQMVAIWDGILAAVKPVIDWFQTYVQPLIQAIIDFIVKLFNFLWSAIVWYWTTIFNTIVGVVQAVSDFIASVWGAIINFVRPIFDAVWKFISGVWTNIYNTVAGIVQNVVSFVQRVWNTIVSIVSTIFTNVYNAIKNPLDDALEFIMGIKDKIVGFFTGAGQWLVDAGKNIINGLIKGIENALKGLTDMFKFITDLIPESKGPPAKDKKLLVENGGLIMQGLINGIRGEIPALRGMLGDVTMGISGDVSSRLSGAGGAAGGEAKTFNYYAAAGGAQLSGQEDLLLAMRRSRMVVPGWA